MPIAAGKGVACSWSAIQMGDHNWLWIERDSDWLTDLAIRWNATGSSQHRRRCRKVKDFQFPRDSPTERKCEYFWSQIDGDLLLVGERNFRYNENLRELVLDLYLFLCCCVRHRWLSSNCPIDQDHNRLGTLQSHFVGQVLWVSRSRVDYLGRVYSGHVLVLGGNWTGLLVADKV